MATLIFDIETVGEEWTEIDTYTQSQLTKWIPVQTDNERERRRLEDQVKDRLGLSPLTGQIITIGVYDLERDQGVVYYLNDIESKTEKSNWLFKTKTSEADLLREFWEGAEAYDKFVSFNGRSFDVPFLNHRSLVYGIKPSKNLLEGRYPSQQKTCRHVDLMDVFTFYGAMSRRPSLHLLCRAYGIASPKELLDGSEIQGTFAEGQGEEIANYNQADLLATAALYERSQLLPTLPVLDYDSDEGLFDL